MSDGIRKNIEVVAQEFRDLKEELATLPPRLKMAYKLKKPGEFFHILSNYLGEPIDYLPRFWFYTWLPKWALVAYLIWYY